jgi:hypothetical protein
MPCQWNPDRECQFEIAEQALFDFAGRRYCALHLPLESDQKPGADAFASDLVARVGAGARDFDGVAFPGLEQRPATSHYTITQECTLRQATVGAGVYLTLNAFGGDLSHATFRAGVTLQVGGTNRSIVCREATCEGELTFEGASAPNFVSFAKTKFKGPVTFRAIHALKSLDLSDCRFSSAPTIEGPEKLPQSTTINGARFKARSADDESAFRTMRVLFAVNRDRDSEGRFYAYEKRCHRRALTRPREWVPRAISFFYDWSSEYGYSYGWPLFWFCILQVVVGVRYSVMSGRFHLSDGLGKFDPTVAAFTFAQIVRPFELFSSKAVADLYSIVPMCGRGGWLALSATQSVLSWILLALFLLALRWRFRRN